MNRRRFVEIFSFMPLIGGIDFDDHGRPGMPNLEGISEKLLFSGVVEKKEHIPADAGIKIKDTTTGHYFVGRWTPLGQLQFKQLTHE